MKRTGCRDGMRSAVLMDYDPSKEAYIMNSRFAFLTISLISLILLSFSLGFAGTVYWTDWTSLTTASPGVIGTLDTDSGPVAVNFSGSYAFAQVSGGVNYWNLNAPYLSSVVDNAPPASDIIALSTGGTVTISFSESVLDPLLALVSWNGNVVDFNVPIDILSFGTGAYGTGTPVLNTDGDGFTGIGEVHGVIRLPGTYDSITFSHTSETWHGFTVGVPGAGAPPQTVPEPGTILLLGLGVLAMAGVRRKLG